MTVLARTPRLARVLAQVLLLSATGLLAAAPESHAATGAAAEQADLVLRGGRIYTVDSGRRTVESLAIRDGRILFAGSDADAARYVGPKTRVRQLGGKLVLPGLVDAHIHPVAIADFGGCDLGVKPMTLAGISDFVRGCITRLKVPNGHWLQVDMWEYTAGNQADARLPTLRAALDAASDSHPIELSGWDGHHSAFNSRALAMARNEKGETVGYSKATLEGDFARYRALVGVDAAGEPTGDIQDDARMVIDSSGAREEYAARLRKEPERIVERLNASGITAIQDAAAGFDLMPVSIFDVFDDLQARNRLSLRVNLAQYWSPEEFRDPSGKIDWNTLFAKADSLRQRYGHNPLIRANAVKVFADGDLEANPNNVPPTFGASPRLVPYLQPIFEKDASGILSVKGYVDVNSAVCVYVRAKPMEYSTPAQIREFMDTYGYHPGQCAISYGVPQHAPAVFNEYIRRAHLAGYTIHVHTIADAGIRMALDAIEAARAADGISSQPDTLAHVQCASPDDVPRIGRDHLYMAFTYSWIYAEPHGYDLTSIPFFDKVRGNSYEAMHAPGNYYERCAYPTKSIKEAGGILAAGSDAPVLTKDPQPFVNMELGVTRARHGLPPLGPSQRLGIRDLIEAYTLNGARALDRAAEIGSLEVGKSADLIVLDQDILKLADAGHPEQIGDTHVLETWFQGRQVYAVKRH
jgi:hypothetical protein